MKYLLTIAICSLTTGECVAPKLEQFNMDNYYGTHYGCVRAGLGNSFELLFDGKTFSANQIEKFELYPKFSCEKIVVPPPKPKPEEPGTPS
jgi:hypothetical protein